MMFGRKNAFSTLVFAKRIRSKSVAFFAGRSAVVAPWGREVSGGKDAGEILIRPVAGNQLVFDHQINAVDKALIDVGDEGQGRPP